MGECGCGDREANYLIKGEDGRRHFITFWTKTCDGCGSPPGLAIDTYEPSEDVRDLGTPLNPPVGRVYIDTTPPGNRGEG